MRLLWPHCRPVCLAISLCVGVCLGQTATTKPTSAPVNSTSSSQTNQDSAPASRETPLNQPTPSASSDVPLAGSLNSLQGMKIAQIQVNSPAVEKPDALLAILPQKANEPLDKYKVRQSVQALYNTGRFAEIQVEARKNSSGELVLSFDTRENYFFGSLTADGLQSHPSDSQLINASKLNLGEQYTEEKINAGIQSMQRTLQDNGYYQATIRPNYEWDSANQQVKVRFAVELGKPARIGVINVGGSPGYSAEEIRKIAKLSSGNKVTADRLTRALQRLRKRYQKKERLEAQVVLTERQYHPETNLLDYAFEINRGPVVEVKTEGATLRRGLVKRFVPIFEEGSVDDDLLKEGQRNIRDYFQSKGYFDVTVSYDQKEEGPDKRSVIFNIDRNERHKLEELTIEGNHYFNREDLRE